MTQIKGLNVPERDGVPTLVDDPAVAAAKEAEEAAAAFNAIGATGDETSTEFVAAEKRTTEADAAFADAPITSVAGALVKMKEIAEMTMMDHSDPGLEARHFKTVVMFLEGGLGGAEPDPAVVAFAEYRKAKAAEEAFPDDVAVKEPPEYIAAGDRRYTAGGAVYDAVPTSLAGVAAKIRFLVDHGERGNDLWCPFDCMAKSILPFLEGRAAIVPTTVSERDPVVALFAEWGAINEEVMVLSASIPEDCGKGGMVPGKLWVKEGEIPWDAALTQREAVERKILKTPATSMRGVAVQIRLATHRSDHADLTTLYATPAREIDYEKECIVLDGNIEATISALRDAERLAGAS